MPRGKLAARCVPVVALLIPVAGCLNSPLGARYLAEGARGPQPQRPANAPPAASPTAAADLRIPAPATPPAGSADVPIVPVPPVPVGGGNIPPATKPAAPSQVVPASFAPLPAASPTPPAPSNARQLVQEAAAAYSGIDSYIARLTRRELINGKADEEVILFKFRKQPWSVYFKWLGEVGKGREVIFVKGQHGSQMHTLLAAGDHPLKPAGSRLSLSPDSIFVKMASRHPITEAGIGASVDRLLALVEAIDHGDTRRGTLADLGVQTRPGFDGPLNLIEHTFPPGLDPVMPRGGKRTYGFDQKTHLPVLVTSRDDKGQEVEYYRYDCLLYPVRLDDQDFDPDRLWGKQGGVSRTAKP